METLLPERLYQRLKRGLFDGEFQPGIRLDYRRLAEDFGVSTTPLREAMAKLASEGLVHLVPRAGAVVVTPDRETLRQLYEVREAIETHAIGLATKRISPAILIQLNTLVDEMERLMPQPNSGTGASPEGSKQDEFLRKDFAFHMVIVAAAGNPQLTKIARENAVHAEMFSGGHLGAGRIPFGNANREHGGILEALRHQDGPGARLLLQQHIRSSLQFRLDQQEIAPAKVWWRMDSPRMVAGRI